MKLTGSIFLTLALAAVAPWTSVHGLLDCLDEAPATVYEATDMSPQNMDYDAANKMFIAHSGWYNDQLVHYYKFRIFAPGTYSGLIAPGSTAADVPLQKMYVVTTDGTLTGSVGSPVIQYHTADGNSYSDFMEIVFVDAPANYAADSFKSEADVLDSGATLTESGIILNIPVVPTGSTLEHPHDKGTMAPIDPTIVWYRCQPITTYIFEVTDQSAADYFADTRTEDPTDFAFAIPVVNFASKDGGVRAIPLRHVNQFSHGVMEGVNGGGPSPAGMRNIINLDRPDPGYSPLWSIDWVTELPVNYKADQATSFTDMAEAKGYDYFTTPMFVNCPDIGNIGEPMLEKTNGFTPYINTDLDSNYILGCHMSLIFQPDVPVSFQTSDGTEIGSTATNMMGAYEYELMTADIPEGTDMINVVANDETIRTIDVMSKMMDMDDTSAAFGIRSGVMGILALAASAGLAF